MGSTKIERLVDSDRGPSIRGEQERKDQPVQEKERKVQGEDNTNLHPDYFSKKLPFWKSTCSGSNFIMVRDRKLNSHGLDQAKQSDQHVVTLRVCPAGDGILEQQTHSVVEKYSGNIFLNNYSVITNPQYLICDSCTEYLLPIFHPFLIVRNS